MIMERKVLKDAIYDWVHAIIDDCGKDYPVVWDNDGGVRPVPPFIALKFGTATRAGMPFYSRVKVEEGGRGEQSIYMPQERVLTIYGIGEDTFDLLQEIFDGIYNADYISLLRGHNLVINTVSDTINESGSEVDNEIENTANFDCKVSYIRVAADEPGWFEHIDVRAVNIPSFVPIDI